ncbi:hypothetical protein AAY473_026016 [Plecturocebus cupreus]
MRIYPCTSQAMATGLGTGQPPRAGSKPSLVAIKVKPGLLETCSPACPQAGNQGLPTNVRPVLGQPSNHDPATHGANPTHCLGISATIQYTWIRLLQGFKNSPTIFREVLVQDLQKFPAKSLGLHAALIC